MGTPATPSQVKELDEAEAKRILTEIARTSGNDAARISAVKSLMEMRKEGQGQTPTGDQPQGFDALDDLAERRQAKGA